MIAKTMNILSLQFLEIEASRTQSAINKVVVACIIMLFAAVAFFGWQLSEEIAIRKAMRAANSTRIQQWQELYAKDSVQRAEWEILKNQQLQQTLKKQSDSIHQKIGRMIK